MSESIPVIGPSAEPAAASAAPALLASPPAAGAASTPVGGGAVPSGPVEWRWRRFDDLTVFELQNIYRARQQVFTLEQQCIYLDADGYDEPAFHLAAWAEGVREPLAYARLVDPGWKYPEASIGRVITAAAQRGTGLGRELLRRMLAHADGVFPAHGLRISAQSRLEGFYAAEGFRIVGERYIEDGIWHTEMVRAAVAR